MTERPPEVFFFGTIQGAGHYWKAPRGIKVDFRGPPNPWGGVDGRLTPGHAKRQGSARLHHLDGWSAVGVHDYTEDSRSNCNANFLVPQPDLTMDQVLEIAAEHMPQLVERIGPFTDADAPTPAVWTIVSVAELERLRSLVTPEGETRG